MTNPSRRSVYAQRAAVAVVATVASVCALPYLMLPMVGERRPSAARALLDPLPGVWLTGSAPVAYDLPSGPYEEQRTAPCGRGQRLINGGCWIALDLRPDASGRCDEGAPYDGKCWIPVHKSNVPLTSIKQAQ